ncbi:MAG: hypothetical protein DWQ37_03655 [Planctomycetota bacterium]|nr:MAG: hypothetical protein DWQ37_03655 [Planctomycetota bacterium]
MRLVIACYLLLLLVLPAAVLGADGECKKDGTCASYVIGSPDILFIEAARMVPKEGACTRCLQPFSGEHLVSPDGTVNLGSHGKVNVAGCTVKEAAQAINKHLGKNLENPQVTVTVFAFGAEDTTVAKKEACCDKTACKTAGCQGTKAQCSKGECCESGNCNKIEAAVTLVANACAKKACKGTACSKSKAKTEERLGIAGACAKSCPGACAKKTATACNKSQCPSATACAKSECPSACSKAAVAAAECSKSSCEAIAAKSDCLVWTKRADGKTCVIKVARTKKCQCTTAACPECVCEKCCCSPEAMAEKIEHLTKAYKHLAAAGCQETATQVLAEAHSLQRELLAAKVEELARLKVEVAKLHAKAAATAKAPAETQSK